MARRIQKVQSGTSLSYAKNLLSALKDCVQALPSDVLVEKLTESEAESLYFDWILWARDDQLPRHAREARAISGSASTPIPSASDIWILVGGRGAGKTRAGAEWVRAQALGISPIAEEPKSPIALVGETFHDVREVMVGGISGLMGVHSGEQRPRYIVSRRRLEWPNGSTAQLFSAEDPESLRGPQFACAWSDELAKWKHASATWDMLQFGMRCGDHPCQCVTTTPRATDFVKSLINNPGVDVTRAATHANQENLAPGFLETILHCYGNSPLGRQEIWGDIVDDAQEFLWDRGLIESTRVSTRPKELRRIVVSIDPPAGGAKGVCGIVSAGQDDSGNYYVLDDASLTTRSSLAWAKRTCATWRRLNASSIVCEINQGGDMVPALLKTFAPEAPIQVMRASKNKWSRAEPVASLYREGRVHHVGNFPELEEQMIVFTPQGLAYGRSPDRVDALVWALSSLAFRATSLPRIRTIT